MGNDVMPGCGARFVNKTSPYLGRGVDDLDNIFPTPVILT
jgi:hypothetical protein